MIVECPMKDCGYEKEGKCTKDSISLKWRFAADLGKGNIVCLECLDMVLSPGIKVVKND